MTSIQIMYIKTQSKFILTPLVRILQDGLNASKGLGTGIETYPLSDYVMQSIFLKMTGAQEQKLKCICWDLATNDYAFRRDYLDNVKLHYGEFSEYKQKNKVYCQLIDEIQKIRPGFNIDTLKWIETKDSDTEHDLLNRHVENKIKAVVEKESKKGEIKEDVRVRIEEGVRKECLDNRSQTLIHALKEAMCLQVKKEIETTLSGTLFANGFPRNFSHWCGKAENYFHEDFGTKKELLCNGLKKLYTDDVIVHRHRLAHNLTSFQHNLPTLDTLASREYATHNYFYRFFLLALIDEIFMRLYSEYTKSLNESLQY